MTCLLGYRRGWETLSMEMPQGCLFSFCESQGGACTHLKYLTVLGTPSFKRFYTDLSHLACSIKLAMS